MATAVMSGTYTHRYWRVDRPMNGSACIVDNGVFLIVLHAQLISNKGWYDYYQLLTNSVETSDY